MIKRNSKKEKVMKSQKKTVSSSAKIKDLQARDMNITREIDRLSTIAANQAIMISRIHQAFRGSYITWEEVAANKVETNDKTSTPLAPSRAPRRFSETVDVGLALRKQPEAEALTKESKDADLSGWVKSCVSSRFGLKFEVRAMKGKNTQGYLAKDGSWVVDAKKIGRWDTLKEAEAALAAVKVPEGTTADTRQC